MVEKNNLVGADIETVVIAVCGRVRQTLTSRIVYLLLQTACTMNRTPKANVESEITRRGRRTRLGDERLSAERPMPSESGLGTFCPLLHQP